MKVDKNKKEIIPKKTSYRIKYNPVDLKNAVAAIKNDEMGFRKASRVFGVPASTIRDRCNGKVHNDRVSSGPLPLIPHEIEKRLVNHLIFMAKTGYPFTRLETMDIASDLAIKAGVLEHGRLLTQNWYYGFIERHQELSLLKTIDQDRVIPPHTSHFTQPLDEGCFAPMKKLIDHDSVLPPHTSHFTQPLDVGCFAPMEELIDHDSVLPPQTSHFTQPLDVGCFAPMKKFYSREVNTFLKKRIGKGVTRFDIDTAICAAYQRAMTSTNLLASVKKNRNISP